MYAFALFYSNVQTELKVWLRDFRVRIILTFAPHELEKSQVEKAEGNFLLGWRHLGHYRDIFPCVSLHSLDVGKRDSSDPLIWLVTQNICYCWWFPEYGVTQAVLWMFVFRVGVGSWLLFCPPTHSTISGHARCLCGILYMQSGTNFCTNKPDLSLSAAIVLMCACVCIRINLET